MFKSPHASKAMEQKGISILQQSKNGECRLTQSVARLEKKGYSLVAVNKTYGHI